MSQFNNYDHLKTDADYKIFDFQRDKVNLSGAMSLAQSPYVKKGLDFNNKRNFVKD